MPEREALVRSIGTSDLQSFIEQRENWVASVLMPTHRVGADVQQDPLRLKNLLTKAREQLVEAGLRTVQADEILAPGHRLVTDDLFWSHQDHGLLLLLTEGESEYWRLPFEVRDTSIVARRFHIKPLLTLAQQNREFFLLAISKNSARFFACTPLQIRPVSVRGMPKSMAEALQWDDPQRQLQFHTGSSSTTAGARRAAMFHGQGVGKDDQKANMLRYVHAVETALRHRLNGARGPLVVAGVDYVAHGYASVNTYANLLDKNVSGNPDDSSEAELHERAWGIVKPTFDAQERDQADRCTELLGRGEARASRALEEILPAAFDGRVEVLFVASNHNVWGSWDERARAVDRHDEQRSGDEDLLNVAAALSLQKGATVYPVPLGEIPGEGDVAAIYRY